MVENSSKPWTSEEEDRLRELVISNAAAFDIAAELWTNRIWARPLFKLIAVHREAAGPAAHWRERGAPQTSAPSAGFLSAGHFAAHERKFRRHFKEMFLEAYREFESPLVREQVSEIE